MSTGINEIHLVLIGGERLVLIDGYTDYVQVTKEGKISVISERTFFHLLTGR